MGLFSVFKAMFSGSVFNVLEGARALTPREQRALAMGHVYAAEGSLPINALTMEADARTAAKLLASAWDVHDNDSYLSTMTWLRESGHRSMYPVIAPLVESAFAQRMNRKETRGLTAKAAADAQRLELDPSQAALLCEGWFNSAMLGGHAALPEPLPTSIAAWDCARAVQLSRLAVDAGFTNDSEAFALLGHFVAISREHHHSWAEFGDAFVTGRAFWSATDVRNPVDQELDKFTSARDSLLSAEDSPWHATAW